MNFTAIRRTTALLLLALLLVGCPWLGLNIHKFGHRDLEDWIHAFVLVQSILLAAYAVYGPGNVLVRTPLVVAWGLVVGFLLARLNLISTQGRASVAAGIILVFAGTFAPLVIFALHRGKTRASLTIGNLTRAQAASQRPQLSLQMLMLVTAAFAVSGVIARAALTAPADPSGNDHDVLVLHMWLGFFPCLAAAPILLVVLRPSWKIVLACGYLVVVTLVDPLLYAFAAPFMFNDKSNSAGTTTWDYIETAWLVTSIFNGQVVAATALYALLARAAGVRMVVPDQSNDKNPNPSAQPAIEAGCVQD